MEKNENRSGGLNSNGRGLDMVPSSSRITYTYDVKNPGFAMLGASCNPKELQTPPGVFEDIDSFEQALQELGWKTIKVVENSCLKKEKFMEIMNNIIQHQFDKNFSIFLVYFTAHGDHEGVLLDDGTLKYQEIIDLVGRYEKLRNIPLIFIFDCCRRKGSSVAKTMFIPQPHTIICFSTCEGGVSIHDSSAKGILFKGSLFTSVLIKFIRAFGKKWPFYDIVSQAGYTTQEISIKNYDHHQFPGAMSSLKKQLFLAGKDIVVF